MGSDIIDNDSAIRWFRDYTSGSVQEEYTLFYEKSEEVCADECRGEGTHKRR